MKYFVITNNFSGYPNPIVLFILMRKDWNQLNRSAKSYPTHVLDSLLFHKYIYRYTRVYIYIYMCIIRPGATVSLRLTSSV